MTALSPDRSLPLLAPLHTACWADLSGGPGHVGPDPRTFWNVQAPVEARLQNSHWGPVSQPERKMDSDEESDKRAVRHLGTHTHEHTHPGAPRTEGGIGGAFHSRAVG